MDAETIVTALIRVQLAASAAIVMVFLLRPLAMRWFGATTAYQMWLLVPLAAMAVLLPARVLVVVNPAVPAVLMPQHIEPNIGVGIARELGADVSATQRGAPYNRSSSDWMIALWLLGAGAFLARSIVNTRRLASSPSIGPALVGVLRPRLVLPQDFETRFNAEERALILAHEEMHRVSRHTLVNGLVEVARCASWFNPLAHLAAGRLRADQELACDTAVIAAHPESRRAYAEALLKAQVAGAYLPMGCVWTSGTAGRLAERIARLSEQLPGRRRRIVGAASIVGIGIATSYAAWAQQPARIIIVQQPSTDSAAVVPDVNRPSAQQAPVRTPTDEDLRDALPIGTFSIGEFFGSREAETEPGAPAIGVSAIPDENTLRRLAVVLGLGDQNGMVDENVMQLMKDPDRSRPLKVAIENQKQKLQDPEYRKTYLATVRMTLKDVHPSLAQKLGLPENESERLLDLLADNQVMRTAEGPIPGGSLDQQQEALRINRELDRREQESIQALLGVKYAQWQDYQKTRIQSLFARDVVIDDRALVNGEPNPTFGKEVCRITRDFVPQLDTSGLLTNDSARLQELSAGCRVNGSRE